MFRWGMLRVRFVAPLMILIQIILSVGIVIGFAFLIPGVDQDPVAAQYLATGAMAISLIAVCMAFAPSMVAQQKMQGIFDFQRALPVPRSATLVADVTTWVLIALPGLAAGLLAAALRFDLELRISPLVLPAVLLVALTCVAIGYTIAYLVPPMAAQMATNVVLFFALMFSPINFPAERLPAWLATFHEVLPLTYMAQAIRETVAVPEGGVSPLPFAVLSAWCLIGLLVCQWVMSRRG